MRYIFNYSLFKVCMTLELLGLAVLYIFGGNGLLSYFQVRAEKTKLVEKIQDISNQIENMEQEITHFQADSFYKEKIAREQLHMARPDDIIIYLKDNK